MKGLSSLVGRDAINVNRHFYNSLFIYLFIYRTAESANPDDICRALGLCYRQKGQKMCALYKKTVKVGYHYVSATSITACLGWKFIFATHAGATIIFIIQILSPSIRKQPGPSICLLHHHLSSWHPEISVVLANKTVSIGVLFHHELMSALFSRLQ